ncbi:MAG: carboxypeptidase regulatory-like domain-containing protein [Planctomycetaceae bacterium]
MIDSFFQPSRSYRPLRRNLFLLLGFWFTALIMPVCGYCQVPSPEDTSLTGTIQGTVRYAADPTHPWRLGRYYIRNAKSGELAEAVVAISARGLKSPVETRESATVVIDQKNFQFTPETTAIRAGDRVRFLNSDNHAHNVKTSHPDFSFNVAMPVGSEHTETFMTASGTSRPYRIDCVFHSAMQAWIFVFDHPWYQVTEASGNFLMKDVPPGEYRLDVVHPAGGLQHRQTIQVVAGKVARFEIRMKPKSTEP